LPAPTRISASFLKSQGLKVKLVEFGDFIQPNAALSQGELDAESADAR